MMHSALSLHNFRSYQDYTVELSPGVNIIVGPNGSGKTNLLEALYVLAQGTSFRVSDTNLVRHDADVLRIESQYGDQRRRLAIQPKGVPTKQFNINGAKRQRLSHLQRLPVVLFEPDEMRLLSGSPGRRRDYLDGLIARLWPEAARAKSQFERALVQRNNILKQVQQHGRAGFEDQLFVWDIKLAEYAQALVAKRQLIIEKYNQALGHIYSTIASQPNELTVRYQSDILGDDYKTSLIHQLGTRLAGDIQRGFTGAGPHRDDILFNLNGFNAANSASRGELRTMVLALKMIELQLIKERSDHSPLLLLDDVFSELDLTRRRALAKLSKDYQTIITTTDADVAKRFFGGAFIELAQAN
jgi:DNA replication and repair protein RecF